MSKFGETADMILEMLKSGKNTKLYLKTELQLKDTTILDFMEEYGFIEIDKDYVNITQVGLYLLAQELDL